MNRIVTMLLGTLLPAAITLTAAAAHTHVKTPSTWTLDVKKSDFGSGPGEKSEVMIITTDTEKWLAYTDVMVDDKGHTSRTSWSGPADGSMHPVKGMAGGTSGWDAGKDTGKTVLPDGTTMTILFSLSNDEKIATFKVDGKDKAGHNLKQTLVYNRTK